MNASHALIAAAMGGILLGASGCGGSTKAADDPTSAETAAAEHDKQQCRGTNECRGKGNCKTDKHACKGQNDCKGQGGCKG